MDGVEQTAGGKLVKQIGDCRITAAARGVDVHPGVHRRRAGVRHRRRVGRARLPADAPGQEPWQGDGQRSEARTARAATTWTTTTATPARCPHPGFDEGAAITLTAAGGRPRLGAVLAEGLRRPRADRPNTPVTVEWDKPVTLDLDPALEQAGPTRVFIDFSINRHGSAMPGWNVRSPTPARSPSTAEMTDGAVQERRLGLPQRAA